MRLFKILANEAKKVALKHAKSLVRDATDFALEKTKSKLYEHAQRRQGGSTPQPPRGEKVVPLHTGLNIIDEEDVDDSANNAREPAPQARSDRRRKGKSKPPS